MKHLIMFSGGIGSWATAKRVAQEHGTADMILLFADTRFEDQDLYRFLHEAAENIGAPLVTVSDGRTPWEVMRAERMIGNTKFDPCSKILKRHLLDKWRDAHCDPSNTILYFGIDWSEAHRLDVMRARVAPWRGESPMCDLPHLTKQEIFDWLRREGIEPPRLYGLGFKHNNCGGACIKAGQGQWARLWRVFPDRYLQIEEWEQEMRALVGDHAILRDRTGGKLKPLTLRAFRARLQAGEQVQHEQYGDQGGCGCAL